MFFMHSLPHCAIILSLALGFGGFTRAANSQTKTQQKIRTGSVSGRITIHGKGAPGIVVGVRSSDFSPPPAPAFRATTDHDGNYQITDIHAGSYQVSPMAPAYVISDSVGLRGRGKTILLAEGEDVHGIDFSITRGGVISGKITDVDGRAIIEERVTIMPEDQSGTRGQMFPPPIAGVFQTDDRGIYRIYGIPPGRYKIYVGVADDERSANFRFGRVSYRRTFYPEATEPEDAKVIEVTESSEATNIDITIGRSLPSFSASGKIVDGETGEPLAGLRLGLRRLVNEQQTPVMGVFTASNSRGEFHLENVTAGKYVVYVAPQPGREVRTDGVSFEILDQDVTGLLLKASKGLTITGNVVLDGTYDKSVLAKLEQLRLQVYVRDENSNSGSWQESVISTDGSFRLPGLGPGKANFSLSSQDRRPPVSFSILRVERDGVVQPRFLEITGEQTTGVKIIVRYGTGSIRGEVKFENGQLPGNARVVVWIKKLGENESNSRPYNLDARGHFLIEGVAAGSYELNVSVNGLGGRRPSPTAKQLIEVSEGAVTEVTVSLDLKSDPGQTPTP
jgi:hypothetical protein